MLDEGLRGAILSIECSCSSLVLVVARAVYDLFGLSMSCEKAIVSYVL
jgi:hypothetical protein